MKLSGDETAETNNLTKNIPGLDESQLLLLLDMSYFCTNISVRSRIGKLDSFVKSGEIATKICFFCSIF